MIGKVESLSRSSFSNTLDCAKGRNTRTRGLSIFMDTIWKVWQISDVNFDVSYFFIMEHLFEALTISI